LVAAIVLLGGCGATNAPTPISAPTGPATAAPTARPVAPQGWQTVEDEAFGFTMDLPAEWLVVTPGMTAEQAAAVASAHPDFSENGVLEAQGEFSRETGMRWSAILPGRSGLSWWTLEYPGVLATDDFASWLDECGGALRTSLPGFSFDIRVIHPASGAVRLTGAKIYDLVFVPREPDVWVLRTQASPPYPVSDAQLAEIFDRYKPSAENEHPPLDPSHNVPC